MNRVKEIVRAEYPTIERHLIKFCDYTRQEVQEVISTYESLLSKVDSLTLEEKRELIGSVGFQADKMKELEEFLFKS